MGSVSSLVQVTFGALATVLFAGLIGNLLTYRWDDARRRRESDLAARERFYDAYAQFFTTWKLWDAHKRFPNTSAPADVQWQMLERAEDAESTFEALLVKLASERGLDDRACRLLAAFRQAYQSLREHIREDEELAWFNRDIHGDDGGYREYQAFKMLAEYLATLLALNPPRRVLSAKTRAAPTEEQAIQTLLNVTTRSENWVALAECELLHNSQPGRSEIARSDSSSTSP